MKKRIAVLLISAMLVVTLSSCATSFPKKESIVMLSQKEATEILKGKTQKEVINNWGDPDAVLSGFYGDIYVYNDKQIVIYYDGDSKVADVLISDRQY